MSNESNVILARVNLRPNSDTIPKEGLAVRRLRVELSEVGKTESAWIAEINVLGILPWLRGEEREVELRIMSDEFRNHATSEKPRLLVKHGSEVVGNLEFK